MDDDAMNKLSRRAFLARSAAGSMGLWMAGHAFGQSAPASGPADEDGYRLWLRYAAVGPTSRPTIRHVHVAGQSATGRAIEQEVRTALRALIGRPVTTGRDRLPDGSLVVGTPDDSDLIARADLEGPLAAAGPEGYVLRSMRLAGKPVTVVASPTPVGALVGVFDLLRRLQIGRPIDPLDVVERPALQRRLMNHWDNLDGSIERGYAGRSLWQWDELPETVSRRMVDYARACASIGINGSVINNVNADPRILTAEYLEKAAALADCWRPYGVRLYLCANFAAPVRIGGLSTADPLDASVRNWWRAKADEIYERIPDFGGFLVKANSEGQPGPKTYGRTHAEGANCLADALAEHGGIVMWRAFVYDTDVDPDRVKRAYLEFTRLDGRFRPNVTIQVKNGPLDFQPREPFHPLFGGLEHTPVMAEIQATQEYTGQAKHWVYLGTMWQEFLQSETYAKGPGSTVAQVLRGRVHPMGLTGVACVVNPGTDTNWCGHHVSQSNWYAFGRLAWNPDLSAEAIVDEWIRMTFTNEPAAVQTIRGMMMDSHEIYVNYTMPLGLHHLIGGDHYAPMPWNDRAPRADWTATYYHRAAEDGIGFDRTRRGSGAVDQYAAPLCDIFDDPDRCPEKLLLWFHRCRWDRRLASGRTLWDELCRRYYQGAARAAELARTWDGLTGRIDRRRHREVAERLAVQVADAAQWRDRILEYFARFSGRPIPESL